KDLYSNLNREDEFKLNDILKHDELYKDYPDAKDIKVVIDYDMFPTKKASYDEETNTLKLFRGKMESNEDIKSTILHEIQHAIQKREGFARGEIEARDVQARMNMPAEDRAKTAPYSSEDISKESAIVNYDNKEIANIENKKKEYENDETNKKIEAETKRKKELIDKYKGYIDKAKAEIKGYEDRMEAGEELTKNEKSTLEGMIRKVGNTEKYISESQVEIKRLESESQLERYGIKDGEERKFKNINGEEENIKVQIGDDGKINIMDKDGNKMPVTAAMMEEISKGEQSEPQKTFTDEEIKNHIQESIEAGKLKIKTGQIMTLSDKMKDFPLYKSIKNKIGEIIKFTPREGQSPLDYVLHFLTKYSINENKDIYSEGYATKIKEIEKTVTNFDDRILGEVNGQDRIYYIRNIEDNKKPYHIVITTDPKNGEVIGWTHFEANEKYKNRLIEREKELIDKRGIIDKAGIEKKIGYNEYQSSKRILPLYLGSGIEKHIHSSQETPMLYNKISTDNTKSQAENSSHNESNEELTKNEKRTLEGMKRGVVNTEKYISESQVEIKRLESESQLERYGIKDGEERKYQNINGEEENIKVQIGEDGRINITDKDGNKMPVTAAMMEEISKGEKTVPKKSVFGTEWREYNRKPIEGVEHLKKVQEGVIPEFAHLEGTGWIELPWGENDANNNGYGLKHILENHPDTDMNKVADIINKTKKGDYKKETENRIVYENDKMRIIIRKDWEGEKRNWILTAYDNKEKSGR
ncbi:MAG TPA: hypothetical protein PLR64_03370, partial [Candidatus Dojkabacteria bacterium]|nr:hypothetical protein [Candidatus Dojkabacteria bacterium]